MSPRLIWITLNLVVHMLALAVCLGVVWLVWKIFDMMILTAVALAVMSIVWAAFVYVARWPVGR